jgi:hypothetical protein
VATKPKLFVGSSSEGLPIAKAIQTQLSDIAEITVWKDGVFRQNDGNLEALLRALDYFDFAVFALSPDDHTTSRDKTQPSPRDNALFEFGLFLGRLDRNRCFAVASDAKDAAHAFTLKLPSDLHGVTVARYESNRSDGNWIAAVGNACTLIADEIKKIGIRIKIEAQVVQAPEKKNCEPASPPVKEIRKDRKSIFEFMGLEDDGSIVVGHFRDSSSNWFHNERFTMAFPGVRGLAEIANPEKAVERLAILLEKPLRWIWQDAEYSTSGVKPIWWWRGGSTMPIEQCIVVGIDEILLDYQELPIQRVVAVNAGAYWQSFVYIETKAKCPTGLYPKLTSEKEAKLKEIFGYIHEEYGAFENRFVTRAEYDDGAAEIDGKPSRIDGVQLRVRYLTPFNLVIAPHESPINNRHFDSHFEELMNGILDSKYSVEDLAKEVLKLPKKDFYRDI